MPGANPAYIPTFQFLVEMEEINLEKKINGLSEFSKKIVFQQWLGRSKKSHAYLKN